MQKPQSVELTLSELSLDDEAIVVEIGAEGFMKQRLYDLGLVPETHVKVLMRSPLGDPMAIEVRGTVIALRREDASQIVVRKNTEVKNG